MFGQGAARRDPLSPPVLNHPPLRETGPRISSRTDHPSSTHTRFSGGSATPGNLKPQSPPSPHRLNSSGRFVEAEVFAVDDHSIISADFIEDPSHFTQIYDFPLVDARDHSWSPTGVGNGMHIPQHAFGADDVHRSRDDSGRFEKSWQLNRRKKKSADVYFDHQRSPHVPQYTPPHGRGGGVAPDRFMPSTHSPPRRYSPTQKTPSPQRQRYSPVEMGAGALADRATPDLLRHSTTTTPSPPRQRPRPAKPVAMAVPISPAIIPVPQRFIGADEWTSKIAGLTPEEQRAVATERLPDSREKNGWVGVWRNENALQPGFGKLFRVTTSPPGSEGQKIAYSPPYESVDSLGRSSGDFTNFDKLSSPEYRDVDAGRVHFEENLERSHGADAVAVSADPGRRVIGTSPPEPEWIGYDIAPAHHRHHQILEVSFTTQQQTPESGKRLPSARAADNDPARVHWGATDPYRPPPSRGMHHARQNRFMRDNRQGGLWEDGGEHAQRKPSNPQAAKSGISEVERVEMDTMRAAEDDLHDSEQVTSEVDDGWRVADAPKRSPPRHQLATSPVPESQAEIRRRWHEEARAKLGSLGTQPGAGADSGTPARTGSFQTTGSSGSRTASDGVDRKDEPRAEGGGGIRRKSRKKSPIDGAGDELSLKTGARLRLQPGSTEERRKSQTWKSTAESRIRRLSSTEMMVDEEGTEEGGFTIRSSFQISPKTDEQAAEASRRQLRSETAKPTTPIEEEGAQWDIEQAPSIQMWARKASPDRRVEKEGRRRSVKGALRGGGDEVKGAGRMETGELSAEAEAGLREREEAVEREVERLRELKKAAKEEWRQIAEEKARIREREVRLAEKDLEVQQAREEVLVEEGRLRERERAIMVIESRVRGEEKVVREAERELREKEESLMEGEQLVRDAERHVIATRGRLKDKEKRMRKEENDLEKSLQSVHEREQSMVAEIIVGEVRKRKEEESMLNQTRLKLKDAQARAKEAVSMTSDNDSWIREAQLSVKVAEGVVDNAEQQIRDFGDKLSRAMEDRVLLESQVLDLERDRAELLQRVRELEGLPVGGTGHTYRAEGERSLLETTKVAEIERDREDPLQRLRVLDSRQAGASFESATDDTKGGRSETMDSPLLPNQRRSRRGNDSGKVLRMKEDSEPLVDSLEKGVQVDSDPQLLGLRGTEADRTQRAEAKVADAKSADAKMEAKIAESDARANALTMQLREKEEVIQTLSRETSGLDSKLKAAVGNLAKREEEVRQLESKVAKRERCEFCADFESATNDKKGGRSEAKDSPLLPNQRRSRRGNDSGKVLRMKEDSEPLVDSLEKGVQVDSDPQLLGLRGTEADRTQRAEAKVADAKSADAKMEAKIAESDARANALTMQLREKEEVIQTLSRETSGLDSKLKAAVGNLAKREEEVRQLESKVAKRELQIAQLRASAGEHAAEAHGLRSGEADTKGEVERLAQEMAQMETDFSALLQHEQRVANDAIATVEASDEIVQRSLEEARLCREELDVVRERNSILEDILEGKEGLEAAQIESARAELTLLRAASDQERDKWEEVCQGGLQTTLETMRTAASSMAEFRVDMASHREEVKRVSTEKQKRPVVDMGVGTFHLDVEDVATGTVDLAVEDAATGTDDLASEAPGTMELLQARLFEKSERGGGVMQPMELEAVLKKALARIGASTSSPADSSRARESEAGRHSMGRQTEGSGEVAGDIEERILSMLDQLMKAASVPPSPQFSVASPEEVPMELTPPPPATAPLQSPTPLTISNTPAVSRVTSTEPRREGVTVSADAGRRTIGTEAVNALDEALNAPAASGRQVDTASDSQGPGRSSLPARLPSSSTNRPVQDSIMPEAWPLPPDRAQVVDQARNSQAGAYASPLQQVRASLRSEEWIRVGEASVSCMRSADSLLNDLLMQIQSNCQAAARLEVVQNAARDKLLMSAGSFKHGSPASNSESGFTSPQVSIQAGAGISSSPSLATYRNSSQAAVMRSGFGRQSAAEDEKWELDEARKSVSRAWTVVGARYKAARTLRVWGKHAQTARDETQWKSMVACRWAEATWGSSRIGSRWMLQLCAGMGGKRLGQLVFMVWRAAVVLRSCAGALNAPVDIQGKQCTAVLGWMGVVRRVQAVALRGFAPRGMCLGCLTGTWENARMEMRWAIRGWFAQEVLKTWVEEAVGGHLEGLLQGLERVRTQRLVKGKFCGWARETKEMWGEAVENHPLTPKNADAPQMSLVGATENGQQAEQKKATKGGGPRWDWIFSRTLVKKALREWAVVWRRSVHEMAVGVQADVKLMRRIIDRLRRIRRQTEEKKIVQHFQHYISNRRVAKAMKAALRAWCLLAHHGATTVPV